MKRKLIASIGWLGLLRIVAQITVVVKLTILTRVLTPNEFGLFALTTTIINSIEALSETGFSYATIYYKESFSYYASTLFFANAIRGIILFLLIMFSAVFLSHFFNNPALFPLLALSSVIPIVKGLSNPYVVLFSKELDFRKEFFYRVFPTIVGAIASIYFGVALKNTLGLVYGLLIGVLFETVFSYIIIPRKFKPKPNIVALRKLFSFGKWMTVGGIFAFLNTQVDNLFIGKFLGSYALGLYDIAFKLSQIVTTEINDTLAKVLFPYFSRNRNNTTKVKKNYFQIVALLSIPALVAAILFNITPVLIIKLLFGSQWVPAAPLLAILSIYGFMRTVIGPAGPLFLAKGKPKILTAASILNFLLIITLLYPFSKLWGISGIAIAMTTSYAITSLLFMALVISLFRKESLLQKK